MKPKPSPNCVHCGKPHGRPLRWIFESCDACDAERDQEMIDASERLVTASCPRCDLLFSVDARPTLTDAEREAIETAVRWLEPYPQVASTLRKLLERMGGQT